MLLFSTILEITDEVTPDSFIKLVLNWNETSTPGTGCRSCMFLRRRMAVIR